MPRPQLIDSRQISRHELTALLAEARHWLTQLDRGEKWHPPLQGKTVVTLFQEPSTRTRASFELAAQYLGAHVFTFQTQGSSLSKGETLEDTIDTFLAMGADGFILRHTEEGLCRQLVEIFGERASFFNGGEGVSDHPTQGLLDLSTLIEAWGSLDSLTGKTLTIVGDIAHSRVASANLALLPPLGVSVRLIGPEAFCPESLSRPGVSVHRDLEEGLDGVDAVMALRIQRERLGEDGSQMAQGYEAAYQLTVQHFDPYPSRILLHPGPTNWGVELHPALRDHPSSRIARQVTHGVAMRMAALRLALAP